MKAAVVSFPHTPLGMGAYLVVAGNPQSINESYDFGKKVAVVCSKATISSRSCVLLNQTTDGVSCEVEWNKCSLLDFLLGRCNICALPDPIHNGKCLHSLVVCGSGAACIGNFVINPFIFICPSSTKL